MHLEVTFRNLQPRDEIRSRAHALFAKLERFLDASSEGRLLVNVEHGQAILELVIHAHGSTHTTREEDEELRTALDKVFHTMEVRLRRSKEKRIDRGRRSAPAADGFTS